jgi:hypothetical protein
MRWLNSATAWIFTILPWLGYGLLTLLVWAACRQVGHMPHIKGPDPRDVMLFFRGDNLGAVLWLSVMIILPASLIAGAMLFACVLDALSKIVASKRRVAPHTSIGLLARVVLFVVGLDLFLRETGAMKYWLLD